MSVAKNAGSRLLIFLTAQFLFQPVYGGQPLEPDQFARIFVHGLTVQLPDGSVTTIPNTATAAALNVTAVDSSGPGFITVYPCASGRPLASNLNFETGDTVANGVVAPIETDGSICFFGSVSTDLVVDLSGWFEGSIFKSIQPTRTIDTREGFGKIGPSKEVSLRVVNSTVSRVGGIQETIPNNAIAASYNITAVNPVGAGFVTVYPCGFPRPLASNVNFVAGQTVPNGFIGALGANGELCVFSNIETDIVADLSGWIDTEGYVGVIPFRLEDTRLSQRLVAGAEQPVQILGLTLDASNGPQTIESAAGAILNVTAVNPETAGFMTVYPCGQSRPFTSNVNFKAGETRANNVIAPLGVNGSVCIFSSTNVDVVVDISGVFNGSGGDSFVGSQPLRLIDTRENLLDTDRDGIPDIFDPSPNDPPLSPDGDEDGDGIVNSLDEFPRDRNRSGDFDGDGQDNVTDFDDDNDLVTDELDLNPFDSLIGAPPVDCPVGQQDDRGICFCPLSLTHIHTECVARGTTVLAGAEFLESGFPVPVFRGSGSAFSPFYMKVGNIDEDPELEIIFYDVGTPLSGWNHDGTRLEGYWPAGRSELFGKMAMGNFSETEPNLEIVVAREGTGRISEKCKIELLKANGDFLNNFPQPCTLSVQRPITVADMNRDGVDEVYYDDNGGLWRIDASGQQTKLVVNFNGPANVITGGNQFIGNPDFISTGTVDLDQDGELELIATTSGVNRSGISGSYNLLFVFEADLTIKPGFPWAMQRAGFRSPVFGDVDGDGDTEIVWHSFFGPLEESIGPAMRVFGPDGTLESTFPLVGEGPVVNQREVLLANLDEDSALEIVVPTADGLYVYKADGSILSGFPVDSDGLVAVGDLDDDPEPEIVVQRDVEAQLSFDNRNHIVILEHDGTEKGITLEIDFSGREAGQYVPVIADLDLDGRNEVLVAGSYLGGVAISGRYPSIWMFDFGLGSNHVKPEWGQQFADERNTNAHHTAPR